MKKDIRKVYLSRSVGRRLVSEYPIGDPFGGPAYGKREEITTVAYIFAAAATAVSAYSSVQQGRAAKKTAEYNAAVQRNNAIATRQQLYAQEQERLAAQRKQLGKMIADYGESGVTLEGSPLDLIGETVKKQRLDIENARYNADLQALGFEGESQLSTMRGKNAETAGQLGAASAILSGASDVYKSSASKAQNGT